MVRWMVSIAMIVGMGCGTSSSKVASCLVYACSGDSMSCSFGADCGTSADHALYSVECDVATGCTCQVYRSPTTTTGTVLPFDARYCARGANNTCSADDEALFAELNTMCGWGLN